MPYRKSGCTLKRGKQAKSAADQIASRNSSDVDCREGTCRSVKKRSSGKCQNSTKSDGVLCGLKEKKKSSTLSAHDKEETESCIIKKNQIIDKEASNLLQANSSDEQNTDGKVTTCRLSRHLKHLSKYRDVQNSTKTDDVKFGLKVKKKLSRLSAQDKETESCIIKKNEIDDKEDSNLLGNSSDEQNTDAKVIRQTRQLKRPSVYKDMLVDSNDPKMSKPTDTEAVLESTNKISSYSKTCLIHPKTKNAGVPEKDPLTCNNSKNTFCFKQANGKQTKEPNQKIDTANQPYDFKETNQTNDKAAQPYDFKEIKETNQMNDKAAETHDLTETKETNQTNDKAAQPSGSKQIEETNQKIDELKMLKKGVSRDKQTSRSTFPSCTSGQHSVKKQNVKNLFPHVKIITAPKISTKTPITMLKTKSGTNVCVVQLWGKTFLIKVPSCAGEFTPYKILNRLLPFLKKKGICINEMIKKENMPTNRKEIPKIKIPRAKKSTSGIEAILKAANLTSSIDRPATSSQSRNVGDYCYLTYSVRSHKHVSYKMVRMSHSETLEILQSFNKFSEKQSKFIGQKENDICSESKDIVKDVNDKMVSGRLDDKTLEKDCSKESKMLSRQIESRANWKKIVDNGVGLGSESSTKPYSEPININNEKAELQRDFKGQDRRPVKVMDPTNWHRSAVCKRQTCATCALQFCRRRDLQRHIQTEHRVNVSKQNQCADCKKEFHSLNLLKKHQLLAHNIDWGVKSKPKLNNGTDFEKDFHSSSRLKIHHNKGLSMKKKQCTSCKKTFASWNFLKKHQVLAHKIGQDLLKPLSINKERDTKSNAKVSMKKLYQCSECKLKFPSAEQLLNHMVHCHSSKVVFSNLILCELCDEAFMSVRDFLVHKRDLHHLQPSISRIEPKTNNLTGDDEAGFNKIANNSGSTFNKSLESQLCRDESLVGEQSLSIDETERELALFYCDVCNKHVRNLQPHILAHTGEKPFKCSCCRQAFTSNACLTIHLKLHTRRSIPFVCCGCGNKFTEESDFNSHTANCCKQLHKCNLCSRVYTLAEELQIHLKEHKDKASLTRDNIFDNDVEPNCNPNQTVEKESFADAEVEFVSADHLYDTNTKTYLSSSPIKMLDRSFHRCTICGKVGSKLRRHMVKHCTNAAIPCSKCRKSFQSTCQLRNHMMQNHKKGKLLDKTRYQHQCQYCVMKYLFIENLHKHLPLHGVNLHKCFICDKSFIVLTDMFIHIKTHEGYHDWTPETTAFDREVASNPNISKIECRSDQSDTTIPYSNNSLLVCSKCNYKFKYPADLTSHKIYKCNICGKVFRKEHILNHMKVHSRLSCDVCGLRFQTLHALQSHQLSQFHAKHQCPHCPKNFVHKSRLSNHLLTHTETTEHSKGPFTCDVCGLIFETLSSLHSHQLSQSHARNQCPQCPKNFLYESRLSDHLLTHNETRSNQCDQCWRSYRYRGDLAKHKRMHQKEKRYKCTDCNAAFHMKSLLRSHIESGHTLVDDGSQLYVCSMCGKESQYYDMMEAHMKTHSTEKSFSCNVCHKQFKAKANRNHHMRVHSDEKLFKCTLCPKQYKHPLGLKNHLNFHAGIKPHLCKMCGKSFRERGGLRVHMRIHTGEKPYECNMCDKRFSIKSLLTTHIATHTGDKKFICNICSRAFAQLTNLVVHRRIHTGERPYACQFCSRGFTTSTSLKKHVRGHTNETPYSCDVCSEAFKFKHQLQRHMKNHGSHLPYNCRKCKQIFVLKGNLDKHFEGHIQDEEHARQVCLGEKQSHFVNTSSFANPFGISISEFENEFVVTLQNETVVELQNESVAAPENDSVVRRQNDSVVGHQNDCVVGHQNDSVVVHKNNSVVTFQNESIVGLQNESVAKSLVRPADEYAIRLQNESLLAQHNESGFEIEMDYAEEIENESVDDIQIEPVIQYVDLPYTCNICACQSKTFGDFNNHLMTHGAQAVIKPIKCNNDFKSNEESKNRLLNNKAHMVNDKTQELPEKTQKYYQCDNCDKKYLSLQSLHRHRVKHTGAYPHKCFVCDKGFTYPNKLYSHIKTHEGYKDWAPEKNKIQDSLVTLNPNITTKECGTDKSNIVNLHADSSLHVCSKCNLTFRNLRNLTSHTLYQCNLCAEVTTRCRSMLKHVKMHSQSSSNCDVRDSRFQASSGLASDKKSPQDKDKDPESKSFQCEVCQKSFGYKDDLVKHKALHEQVKHFKCLICNRVFDMRSLLKSHIQLVHTPADGNSKSYRCNVCGKESQNYAALQVHVKTHSTEKPFSCEVCHKQFKTKSNRNHHMRVHSDEKLFKCTLCPKQYRHPLGLKNHLNAHAGIKPYSCKICGKSFRERGGLCVHMRIHTGEKPYECNMCDKRFNLKSLLTSHIATHTGEKKFVCNICDRAFIQRTNLVVHKRMHTGERPYGCQFCSRGFTTSTSLKEHVRVHTNEKPYSCDVCSEGFKFARQLLKHMKSHGSEKPYMCRKCRKTFVLKENLDKHYEEHIKNEQNARQIQLAEKEKRKQSHIKNEKHAGNIQQKQKQLQSHRKDEAPAHQVQYAGHHRQNQSNRQDERHAGKVQQEKQKQKQPHKKDGKDASQLQNAEQHKANQSHIKDERHAGKVQHEEQKQKQPHSLKTSKTTSLATRKLKSEEHHVNVLALPYSCDICGSAFQTVLELNTHKTSHLFNPFKCALCSATFSNPNLLSDHLIDHIDNDNYDSSNDQQTEDNVQSDKGGKLFTCRICCKMFPVENLLTAHEKSHESANQDDTRQANSIITSLVPVPGVARQYISTQMISDSGPMVMVEYSDNDFSTRQAVTDGNCLAENGGTSHAGTSQESIVIEHGESQMDQQQ